MMELIRWVAGIAVLLAVATIVGALSQFPVAAEDSEDAILRLSWRVRSQEVGECPTRGRDDLDRLPVHMRNPDACVGPLPAYDLQLRLNGELHLEQVVEGGGARGDRPLYVLEDIRLPPDTYRVEVTFERRPDPGDDEGIDMGRALSVDTEASMGSRTVTLVTRAGDTGNLELRRPR